MSEVWNNVTILGPAPEIERFRRLCLAPSEDVYRPGQFGWDGCDCHISVPANGGGGGHTPPGPCVSEYVWNFQQFTSATDVEYSFSFDTGHAFPVELFDLLARCFRALAFDCNYIDSMDEFMGFGWFNGPPGGEEFRQDLVVPADYWTGGRAGKRDPAAQMRYEASVEWLRRAAAARGR